MKKLLLSTIALTGLLPASPRAGPAVEYKQAPPPPPPVYGLGFYGALDMEANVYQNRGENRTFTDNNPDSEFFGSNLEVDPKNDVGFYGGIKLGYVFGTPDWVIRPAVEGDFFYNGFRSEFFGSNLEVDPKNDVGFYGGIKLGYVFGTPDWVIRPAVEGDFFYNGFRSE